MEPGGGSSSLIPQNPPSQLAAGTHKNAGPVHVLRALPITLIPRPSKSSYPVSSCSAPGALSSSSNLPPPPADLLSFTKICRSLPLAPGLWQDPKALRSFGFCSRRLSFPAIFVKRAGFLGVLLFFQLRKGVPGVLLAKKSRFCCTTTALVSFPALK